MAEIHETRELAHLLVKATYAPLNKEEVTRVKAQLIEICRAIPALGIFALPGGAFLLPFLIHILPFEFLPANFRAEKFYADLDPKDNPIKD
jgi:hypothetical protein